MRTGRMLVLILIMLLVAGLAVGFNHYASQQADEIAANAPAVLAEAETAEADDSEGRMEMRQCEEAQAEYDEVFTTRSLTAEQTREWEPKYESWTNELTTKTETPPEVSD